MSFYLYFSPKFGRQLNYANTMENMIFISFLNVVVSTNSWNRESQKYLFVAENLAHVVILLKIFRPKVFTKYIGEYAVFSKNAFYWINVWQTCILQDHFPVICLV